MLTAEYDEQREIEKLENTIRIYAERKGRKEGREKGREEVLDLLALEGVSPDIIKISRNGLGNSKGIMIRISQWWDPYFMIRMTYLISLWKNH